MSYSTAENEFINEVSTTAHIGVDDAAKVYEYYKKYGLVKLDAFGKTLGVKHTEFWNKEAILCFLAKC